MSEEEEEPGLDEVGKQLQAIGHRIGYARRRRGKAQREIAYFAGITRLTLSRIENGVRGVAFASYLAVLNALQLQDMVKDFVAPERDAQGEAFGHLHKKRAYFGKNDRW
jgi:transcriptional regulator with XRE-family HTH domain